MLRSIFHQLLAASLLRPYGVPRRIKLNYGSLGSAKFTSQNGTHIFVPVERYVAKLALSMGTALEL